MIFPAYRGARAWLGVAATVLACSACASGTDAPTCNNDDVCIQAYGAGAICTAERVCQRGTPRADAMPDGAAPDDGATSEAGSDDAGTEMDGATPPPPPPPDTGVPPADSGPPEMDAGPPPTDTGPPPMDTGPPPADTGPRDSGPMDAGPRDTGPADTGPRDSGPADTGPRDSGPAMGPPPGSIVINELDYDQVGTDTAEFVELYNRTDAAISLSGLSLLLFNCATADAPIEYSPSPVVLSGTIPARGYALIAVLGVGPSASGTLVRVDTPGFTIQNGAARAGEPGDGLLLLHVPTSTAIDAVAYENRCGTVRIGGRDIALTEGTATSAADSDTMAGSLSRLPDGTDTADNSRDFAFTTSSTPGAPNR